MSESGGGAGGSSAPATVERIGDRTRFAVELRPGETTIVSWKKLMKDASRAERAAAAPVAAVAAPEAPAAVVVPALESRLAPGQPDANEEAPAPNRFNAVIEKIERLYKGKDSSDEEDLDDIPDDDQYDTEDSFIDDAELDEYFQVDKSKTKHDGYFVNRGTLEKVIEPPEPVNQQPKKRRRKEMVKGAGNDDDVQRPSKHIKASKKSTGKSLSAENVILSTSEGPVKSFEETKFQNHQKIAANDRPFSDLSLRTPHDDGSLTLAEISENQKSGIKLIHASGNGDRIESMNKSHSLKNSFEKSEIVVHPKDKSTMRSIDLNLPDTKQSVLPLKNSAMHKKEGSSVKSKANVLEKAIRELEKMVAESRPPAPDAHDGDSSSQSIKRRLPPEIKQKLTKVARLAPASNGDVSKELLTRLMGIVGHLCQVRTLKRHLKIMVTTSLSDKQDKDDKFKLIKKDVVEMVKARIPSLMSKGTEQQSGGSGDLQESGQLEKVAKGQAYIDAPLEDKICDLYDTFVEGLDEDVAPQVRKLYAELAELWPKGIMDNHGIKRAICRAKERRKTSNEKNKDQEKIRKKVVATNTEGTVRVESNLAAQSQCVDMNLATDPTAGVLAQQNRFSTSFEPRPGTTVIPMNTAPIFTPLTNVPNPDRPKQEKKVKATQNTSLSNGRSIDGCHVGMKKRVKKRAESSVGEVHTRPEKFSSHQVDDRPRQHKHPAVALQGAPHKSTTEGFRFEPLM